ncbi:ABC-F type ribosomal protection protein [Virgibacillus pantothenticus]|uniref:ribosomal protection-like ABC-F family protein n=1 Tax=Virgibacillus pantothenticus TaxID=1473 RepID=UPI001C216B39|nr:ABC-F type ribosomal protection protein [Virgibacillus pantothenticus]MBU8565161.1 ABC-F type ribosomal protection protein [Virgibacillus pantothenticus]MBU8601445.1 ABC-F type ribosomal protection protein [Virgibacillus pantothenticus]MBU8633480.1 ABC-F type ribosomal protection protein [Virgibacillus pantothenticus]MBU8643426.1 ABC-F type ribosomal protection protein [Virgibacillus pantothenticus]MBU8647519.1 ABC-F type ribosomal protection protein [Virgibacillus pantothenticus]
MITASLQQVTQTIGANLIFENITAEVKQGERIGLIGRNGTGKSTLLQLLARKSEPAKGIITWKKNTSVGLLLQNPVIEEESTVEAVLAAVFTELNRIKTEMEHIENLMGKETSPEQLTKLIQTYGDMQERFQKNGGYEIDARVRRVMSGLQIEELATKLWNHLSGGERTKVGLAQLLLQAPDLLLLDEPTNHLDFKAIEWLTEFIRHYKGTIVIVSHDRYFLDDTVTKIWELDQRELITYATNYTNYVKEREERLLQEFQQYQDQQKKIKKMKETIKRLKEWANQANPPNDGLHRRAKSMEKALEKITRLKRPVLEHKRIRVDFKMQERSGKEVVKLKGVSKKIQGKGLFQDVDMLVRFQERVAIIGENGAGKSTLLQLIVRRLEADEGNVQLGSNLSIGFLSQHMLEMEDDRTVIDEFREQVPVEEGKARAILARFLFYGSSVFQQTRQLSGGEKTRLRLAQLMYQDHNVLILDEPTNHLDIESKEALEEALEQFAGTIIAVSHDRYFLDRLFPVTYLLQNQKIMRFEGNYSYVRKRWLEK